MKLPNFGSPSGDSTSKIGHDFNNNVVKMWFKNLSCQKTVCTKNVLISFDYS